MKMLRKLNFDFVDNTLYKIEYHGPGRNENDAQTVIAAYIKTDEKFHYEFGHPYDPKTGKITASSIGIRTQEFHSIHPVDAYERHYWKEAVADFMMGIRKSGSVPTCYERVDEVDMYKGDAEFFDFQKIRQDHYRTEPLDYKAVHDNIITGLTSYLNRYHIKSMVLGVSGGIDSTVVAALAHEVAEKWDVELWLASLPSNTNQDDEQTAAHLAGEEFTDKEHFIVQPIDSMFMLCKEIFGAMETGKYVEPSPIACGNIKARLRNNLLYHLAGVHKGIVLDTDNLPEHYLSFFTIHGDTGDFNPIGHLWKHEVYGLAKWILENIYPNSEALKRSIALVPTDGNGVKAGGDMAQIAPGHTYDDVDDILMTYLEYKGHHSEEYQIAMNELYEKYTKETVDRVINRHVNSEFKRRHVPLVIDIFDACVLENDGKLVF